MTYMYPFPRGTQKSQVFAANPNNGVNPPGGHTGDDWVVDAGTPVRAAANGIVRNSSWLSDNYQDNGWWLTRMGGDTLVLDATDSFMRSDGLPTFIYAHLSDSIAEVGAYVRKGDIIALSGNSGTATTGPHCHVETLPPNWDFNNGTYGRVNPEIYFDEYWDGIAAQGTITQPPEEDFLATLSTEEKDALFQALARIDTAASDLPRKQYWEDLIQATARIDQKASAPDIAAQINAAGIAVEVRDELVKLIGGK